MDLIVADFGSAARYISEDNKVLEFDSSVIIGSREYNAPEINMNKCYYGDKADIFSAAVCLFVMVVGNIPFRMASYSDPYFKLLTKKDKKDYWAIYSSIPISFEFKGIFHLLTSDFFIKLTEQNVEKRLTLAEARNHSWMKGKMLDSVELAEEMKDRLQIFEDLYHRQMELCKKELEERKEKHEWELLHKDKGEQVKFTDPVIQRLITECAELNLVIEKQRRLKESQEKLSDDQVNSMSDDSRGECSELKVEKGEEVRLDVEVEESIYEFQRVCRTDN
jgi:serine/threonine protein kinase